VSSIENKCPLCGKLNPLTEWICEECGAQLPLHGQKTTPVAAKALSAATPATNIAPELARTSPAKPDACGQMFMWGCVTIVFLFIVLPFSCSVLQTQLAPTPTPTPIPQPTAAPTPYTRTYAPNVWVNTNTGVYHYPGDRWYGKTSEGAYMTEQDAIRNGYRASRE
jgi:hypothetical protein